MNRNLFLKLAIGAFVTPFFLSNSQFKSKRLLCFNTLACPKWSLKEVLENAHKMGYGAVEIRGILSDIDILKSPAFRQNKLSDIKKMAAELDVAILNLNSSAVLHEYETGKKNFHLDNAKQYIDLAQQLNCPFVRLFPEKFHEEKSKNFTLDVIKENLSILTEYCKGSEVKVLLDTHGDLVWSDDIKVIMKEMDAQHSGIIWDFFNMHLKTKESPEKMFATLKEYIALIQLKDGYFGGNNSPMYTLTSKGEVPITKILGLLDDNSYSGYISFEWEKRWHPELPDPEVALPQFVEAISRL